MKIWKIILGLIFLLFLIITFPVFLDWWIFSNNFPSNLTNGEWAGFLGSYIGSLIGSLVSVIGIVVTIQFTKRQIELSQQQYEEQKRLNNIPILDCRIINIHAGEADDALRMDVEYTLNSKTELNAYTITMDICNIGIGVASDLKYGMKVNGKEEDGEFWFPMSRVLRNGENLIQSFELYIPNTDEFNPTLLIRYEDVLENKYEKSVDFLINRDACTELMFHIISQDKGKVISKKEKKLYYVIPN